MASGMHELARPSDSYQYILGLYHIIDTLTTKYPDVLWEGCASGGGRFDAGTYKDTSSADSANIP
jgi:alpha-galactosidase